MLLIDGVKYYEWTPEKEVEQFHPLVKEHIQEIFGIKSKFIEGSRLQSAAKKGSEPDGFVLVFGNEPQWHILEMELSCHQLYDHIVNQVGRFINGIENSRKKIIDAIYRDTTENKVTKAEAEEAIGSGEIYKFLTDLITKPPVLTIIIENKTKELEEAVNLLRYSPIKIVEFRTFRRESAENVHAYLFEPLIKSSGYSQPRPPPPEKQLSRNLLYNQFFKELILRNHEKYPSQPLLTAPKASWLSLSAGKSGFYFDWIFRKEKMFSVELYIDVGDKEKNKKYFDSIKQESKINIPGLSWERLDDKKASRIAVYTSGEIQSITNDPQEKEKLIDWGIETMKKFIDTFGTIIKTLK